MKYLKYLSFVLLLLSFWSCDTSKEKKQELAKNNASKKEYTYTVDTSGVLLIWTAYKFTNKVGVSGTFNDYAIAKKRESGAVEDILDNLKLTILTSTIDTKNPIRDFKLDTYFFKAFNTPKIIGTIVNAKDNEGFIKLQMNKRSRKIPYTYSLINDTITLFTHLDLNLWTAEKALNTLNKECYELHKGADGISKLWPDMDVSIKLPIKKSDTNEL